MREYTKCVKCGSQDNLHFDHIIPYSKGGSSLVAENIQILCARYNIAKRDKIEWLHSIFFIAKICTGPPIATRTEQGS